MDDWKYEKQWYNKQGKLLEWLCSIKIEPKKKKEFKLKRDRSAETIRKNNNDAMRWIWAFYAPPPNSAKLAETQRFTRVMADYTYIIQALHWILIICKHKNLILFARFYVAKICKTFLIFGKIIVWFNFVLCPFRLRSTKIKGGFDKLNYR